MTASVPSRNRNLDLIRLIAAILVLFSHCYPLAGRAIEEPFLWTFGHTGGDIALCTFFVISGYLISASYIRSQSALDYAWKRCLRIFPALFFAVFFSIILGALLTPLDFQAYVAHEQTTAYLRNIFLDIQYNLPLVFSENPFPNAVNGSLWTLPIEFFMYAMILAMGVAGILSARFSVVAAGLCIFGVLAVRNADLARPYIVLGAAELSVALRLGASFFIGAALYFYRDKIRYHGGIALLFLAIIFFTKFTPPALYLYALLLPYIIFYLASVDIPWLDNITRHGDFSYGIYIYAFPIQQLLVHWFNNSISVSMLFIGSLAITLPIAVLSWKFVEEPALRRLKPVPRSANA
ncbi:acyltransferase [Acidovorax sp. CCYZU-2555]|uniref:acyltransferase family protein n=1 Tax=Acidovorax sp. CCYZU-2555 TaxID=2835042 RepID=UPI001BD00E7D|nr:acyltransferase [Acidovorax sp. CCYZU-2555]MBS7777086.1 acyltransferase [Acidovorax sp. CCYZU-2555]